VAEQHNFGFKQLSLENWLTPEDLSFLVSVDHETGIQSSIDLNGWAERFLRATLDSTIPPGIRALFEVARGAMLYGCFFYPLFTLATEQLFRVHESALTDRCKKLGASASVKTFADKIAWLETKGVVSGSDALRWNAVRHLRNAASHPQGQMILMPTDALTSLDTSVELINRIYVAST
jgi:hypothetical protein